LIKWEECDHFIDSFYHHDFFFFSRDNSPSVRLLLNDQLFLRHLDLFLARPSKKHFHQLRNRAKTLHRRRTDEVSTRFFLRD
jgi:hypothetical protein